MATPVTLRVPGSAASKPTTTTLPAPENAAGSRIASQSASSPASPSPSRTVGSQSSMVLARTIARFSARASLSLRSSVGWTKSRSGSPEPTTSRTVSPYCRAERSSAS